MSFYNKPRGTANVDGLSRPGRPSSSWIIAAVIAVLVLLALGYVFGDRLTGTSGTAEHATMTTDAPAPGAAPVATPGTTPKQ